MVFRGHWRALDRPTLLDHAGGLNIRVDRLTFQASDHHKASPLPFSRRRYPLLQANRSDVEYEEKSEQSRGDSQEDEEGREGSCW